MVSSAWDSQEEDAWKLVRKGCDYSKKPEKPGHPHPIVGDKTILDQFFWPLTEEAKKGLFTQCCQKLFLVMDEYDAEDFWNRWLEPLFDVTQAPFKAIVNGQACEIDMLFYTALVAG